MSDELHIKRDGTVLYGSTPIGRVVREVDGWSPTELNGDYLGMTHYNPRSDAVIVLLAWWLSINSKSPGVSP